MQTKVKTRMVKVRADKLQIHPHAQRELSPMRIKKLVDSLDLDAIGVVHAVMYRIRGVSRVWVVDGQHRVRALLEHGFGEWLVDVMIHSDVKDDAAASALFLKLNNYLSVQPFDKFLNELTAGVPAAVGLQMILKKHHLSFSRSTGDGKLACVMTGMKLWAKDEGKLLDQVLSTIQDAWGAHECALEGKIVEGLGLFLARFDGQIDFAALTKRLAKYPGGPGGLIGDARALLHFLRVPLSRCVAKQITDEYNKYRRESRLADL